MNLKIYYFIGDKQTEIRLGVTFSFQNIWQFITAILALYRFSEGLSRNITIYILSILWPMRPGKFFEVNQLIKLGKNSCKCTYLMVWYHVVSDITI